MLMPLICQQEPVDLAFLAPLAERPDYMCGVPRKKQYRLILDSSDMKYGGPTEKRQVAYRAKEGECDGQPYRIAYALPAYGVAVFSF